MKDEKSKSCQKDMQQREKFRRLIYSFSGMEGNSFSANSIHVIDNIIIIPFVIYIKKQKDGRKVPVARKNTQKWRITYSFSVNVPPRGIQ